MFQLFHKETLQGPQCFLQMNKMCQEQYKLETAMIAF